jgi:hypothetical protein
MRMTLIAGAGILCILASTAFNQDFKKKVSIETNSNDADIYIDGRFAGKGRHLDTILSEGWYTIEGKLQNGFSDIERVKILYSPAYIVRLTVRKFRVLFEPRFCFFYFSDGAIYSAYPHLGIQFYKNHFAGADLFLFGSGHSDFNLTGSGLSYSYSYENEHFGIHAGGIVGGYKFHHVKKLSSGYGDETFASEKTSISAFLEPSIGAAIGWERVKFTGDFGVIIGSDFIPMLSFGISSSI